MGSIRQRRQAFAGRGRDSGSAAREQRIATAEPTARGTRAVSGEVRAPDRRRELGPVQDQALYTCSCGFVFEAQVSTSVDCPRCGTGQAW